MLGVRGPGWGGGGLGARALDRTMGGPCLEGRMGGAPPQGAGACLPLLTPPPVGLSLGAAGGTQGQEGGVTAPPLPPAALAVAFCRRSLSWTTPPAPPWVESTVFGAGQAPLPSPSARRRGAATLTPSLGCAHSKQGCQAPVPQFPLCDLLFPPLLSWVTPRFPHWSKGLWGAVILPSPSSCTPSL